jgi:hypothetical protein
VVLVISGDNDRAFVDPSHYKTDPRYLFHAMRWVVPIISCVQKNGTLCLQFTWAEPMLELSNGAKT